MKELIADALPHRVCESDEMKTKFFGIKKVTKKKPLRY
jgi:hypothetical protein